MLGRVGVRSILDSFYNVYFLHICLDVGYPRPYVCIVNHGNDYPKLISSFKLHQVAPRLETA